MDSESAVQYRIDNVHEIQGYIGQLREQSCPLTLSGADRITCAATVLELDAQAQRLSLACIGSQALLQKTLNALIECDTLTANTQLDGITLRFDLRQVTRPAATDSGTFQTALPVSLYRFQRRNSYRLKSATPTGPALQLPHLATSAMPGGLKLRIADVSISGCALLLPSTCVEPVMGSCWPGAKVALDGDTRFTADLHVRSVRAAEAQGLLYIGCEWQRLDGMAQRHLQRYVDAVQRRRRLMAVS